ncbi:NlpC/P60 family protein [Streptomyces sp. NPDC004647]|uniref:C40 family peptidase n=1 Tax=Streptomyces sp. NPDC004647 TaxID=3154671 RepID=UPI00339EBDD7
MASHRRPSQSGFDRPAAGVTVLSAAVATAAALSATPAGADPQDTAADVKLKVDRLYEQAEKSTEKFHAADERRDRLRKQVDQVQNRVARGQERVNRMRDGLATLAGAQYRSGGLEPALTLMLSEDPEAYLERASTLDRIGSRQTDRLLALQKAQRSLRQQREEAAVKLADLERSRAEVVRQKRAVEHRLATARRLLNSLSREQREAYDRASRTGDRSDAWFAGPEDLGPSSSRAAAAVAAARRAVGSPYVWGKAGPDGFDCSGLTQWSYAQAGVAIPRTSQAQRNAGRQVPLGQARPGDLVTYRGDASHVGMYVGNGQVVHAPYPGAQVRYDPVGMIPGATVTRV